MPVVAYTLRIRLFNLKSDICGSIRWHGMKSWGRRQLDNAAVLKKKTTQNLRVAIQDFAEKPNK
jgi:hypothetical protein